MEQLADGKELDLTEEDIRKQMAARAGLSVVEMTCMSRALRSSGKEPRALPSSWPSGGSKQQHTMGALSLSRNGVWSSRSLQLLPLPMDPHRRGCTQMPIQPQWHWFRPMTWIARPERELKALPRLQR